MDSSLLRFSVAIEELAEQCELAENTTNKICLKQCCEGALELLCDSVSEGDSGQGVSEAESVDDNMPRVSSEYLLTDKTTKDDINVIVSAGLEDKVIEFDNKTAEQQVATPANKADLYTTTVGCYVAWNNDVDLGPPSHDIPVPDEDKSIFTYYEALQYTLYETGFPETENRLEHPVKADTRNEVTIAILSSPVECMGILLEGGRQCPGNMLLILSPTWLSKRKCTEKSGLYSLYVHKAITFDSAGRSFIDLFEPPRRVTYFVNFFTRGCTDGARNDGEELEADLDCPTSSSITLSRMVDDKLFTRILMSEVGVAYPETLAFTYCTTLPYDVDRTELTVVSLDTKLGVDNLMLEEITKFTASSMMQAYEKVVVKPSGMMWHASCGVTYHARNDVVSIWKAALALLTQLEEEDVILVEAFYHTIHHKPGSDMVKWAATEQHAARVRATVCRGGDNRPHMTKVVCGVGLQRDPVNGDNTIPQSLDTTLLMMGVLDRQQRDDVNARMARCSEATLQRLMDYEMTLSESERGGVGAQTDVIGIDYVLTDIDGVVTPVAIEVNSHDCTINCHIYEFMYPYSAGEAFRPLIENMIARSQRFIMRGKRIVVIGAGGYSKKFIWNSAVDFGIQIILIDNDATHFASKLVAEFITYDLTDHTQDDVHAHNIVQLLADRKLTVDGCLTFWEDCGPLAAAIADLLGLCGPGLRGALAAKRKSSTQQVLRSRTGDIPHWPRTYLYTSKAEHVDSKSDIEAAVGSMTFPCMMKLEYGSSAVGVALVHNVEECLDMWNRVQQELHGENSHPGIGLGHGNSMLLMDYVGGTEHDVDIIIYRRKLIGAFVSDNGPTRIPRFTETAAAMPSFLPADKCRQLIVAAYQCCVEIGLVSGVFNVELKMTTTGPKLIEINARMGGFYLRDWIRTLYNVDTLMCAFMVACNVCPLLSSNTQPAGQLIGVMTVPSAHRKVLSDPNNMKLLQLLEDNGFIRVNRIEPFLPPPEEDCYEEPYASIAVFDSDPEVAKTKIIGVFNLLGMNTKEYPVEEFLKDFRRS